MRNKHYSASSGDTQMFSSPAEEIEFRVDPTAFAAVIDRLTDVYTTPAVSSVREVFSNAYDASVKEYLATGEKNEIVFSLPTFANDNYLSIRDYGCGMDMDDIKKVFTGYGTSTKVSDMSSTGSFGLGAKSPLALVSSFRVETIKNGEKLSFTVVRHPGEVPKIIDISSENTGERNGTVFSIPMSGLSNEDLTHIGNTVFMLANFSIDFPVRIENSTVGDRGIGDTSYGSRSISLAKDYSYSHSFEHDGELFRVFIRDNTFISRGASSIKKWLNFDNSLSRRSSFDVSFLLNGYLYPNKENYYGATSPHADIIVELKPGVVDFPSSRDSITDNERKRYFIDSYPRTVVKDTDFAHLAAQVISKNIKGDNNRSSATLCKAILSSVTDEKDLELILQNEGKTDELGRTISLGKDFIQLSQSIIDGKTTINAASFYYNFDEKNVSLYSGKENSLMSNNENNLDKIESVFSFKTKTDANSSFAHHINTLHSDSYNDVKSSLLSMVKKPDYGKIIIVNGKDKKLSGLSRKFGQIDNTFGSNRAVSSALFVFPAQGKISKNDKEALENIANVVGVELIEYDGVSHIPMRKRTTSGLDTLSHAYKWNWEGCPDNDETSAIENLATTFNANGFYGISLYPTYENLLEKLQEENTHLIILPKSLRHEPSIGNRSHFIKHALILAELYGKSFVEENTIYMIEHPNQSLTKALDDASIEYTVIGEKDKFKRKGLSEVAIQPFQTKIEIETIFNKMTPQEIEKEVTYQFAQQGSLDWRQEAYRQQLTELFSFVTKNHLYFDPYYYDLASEMLETIKKLKENSQPSDYSARLTHIAYRSKMGVSELFKKYVPNIDSKFRSIEKEQYLELRIEQIANFSRFYKVFTDEEIIKTLGIEKVTPFADHLMKEIEKSALEFDNKK